MTRNSIVFVAMLAATAAADAPGPPRWQKSLNAPSIARMWGSNGSVYGVGGAGAYSSRNGGATWAPIDGYGPANGVWGTGVDDIWIVRARTIHHSVDGQGKHWTNQSLPMLSFDAAMEGIWGVDRDRYVFGVDRSDGTARGTILRSRDRGMTWRDEPLPVAVERVAGMWGSASNDVYAVGARGVILHSRGDGQWRIVRAPTTGSLEGIWGTSATSIYAVGTSGAILHSSDRGKTWTARASGVTYTLSSIVGLGNELYASSADGAPLRSSDGRTWKPITALVQRGHVWPTDRERLVVAGGNDVYFLDGAQLAPAKHLPMIGNGIAQVKTHAARFGNQFPHARDLLLIAANRLGDPAPLSPNVRRWFPTIRLGKITGCSPLLDAYSDSRSPRSPRTEVVFEITCQQTCATARIPRVQQTARILRDGVQQGPPITELVDTNAEWCLGKRLDFQLKYDAVMKVAFQEVERALASGLANASSDEVRVEQYARYLLDGGQDKATARTELARILGQPSWWPGFFWSSPTPLPYVPLQPPAGTCDPVAIAQYEKTGDDRFRKRNFVGALERYDRALGCKTRLLPKAYLAACRAKENGRIVELYVHTPLDRRDEMAETCARYGFDPRKLLVMP